MSHFQIHLLNVKRAYVTFRDFTPDLKKCYVDISAIFFRLCNSELAIHHVVGAGTAACLDIGD